MFGMFVSHNYLTFLLDELWFNVQSIDPRLWSFVRSFSSSGSSILCASKRQESSVSSRFSPFCSTFLIRSFNNGFVDLEDIRTVRRLPDDRIGIRSTKRISPIRGDVNVVFLCASIHELSIGLSNGRFPSFIFSVLLSFQRWFSSPVTSVRLSLSLVSGREEISVALAILKRLHCPRQIVGQQNEHLRFRLTRTLTLVSLMFLILYFPHPQRSNRLDRCFTSLSIDVRRSFVHSNPNSQTSLWIVEHRRVRNQFLLVHLRRQSLAFGHHSAVGSSSF